ncbi:NAD(P)/FAD-dependent oxidoreductase [Rhodococcus sp. BGS-1C]|jgi:cation diffusion facilitator CzcD-associated flavoprotein CzcO|uniref:flavin-containing monooxygenase n=1 Tax=unclassified Rhodococcus (in: high G+C Gram-positive bacteria) TaxID=192944 RepID=UPI0019D1E708|nr:NAD(P)/FAD-dependent oxidoreductase [Rhodococcus sp. KRD197]
MNQQRNGAVPEQVDIAIIGAGVGGIGLAVKLRDAGFGEFVILERSSDLGGTWRDNTYPGCACDVPSHLYSYSFAQNPDWSRTYGKQPEILAYLHSVAQDHDVVRHIRFDTEVLDAAWDEVSRRWRVHTDSGDFAARILISATGVYGGAKFPDIPGMERFTGTSFHSLHWNHDHDLTGERVAVLGTGASAVQFVPEIQPRVARLLVFQRSAPWIIPRLDRATSRAERALIARLPIIGKGLRGSYYAAIEAFGLVGFIDKRFRHPYEAMGKMQLLRQVRDSTLRKRLTPDYMIGCKRAIFSDSYLPSLTKNNVEVIDDAIAEIREHSILTRDGVEHRVDTIIYGTGFEVPPAVQARIRGRDGQTLADLYTTRPQSYLGATLAGFPNFFTTLGAFGAVGNQSAIYMIECQIRYIVDALATMRTEGLDRVEVRKDAQEAFLYEVNERSARTVWLTGGCATTYYRTAEGKNAGLYPNWSFEYANRTRRFDRDAYELGATDPSPAHASVRTH